MTTAEAAPPPVDALCLDGSVVRLRAAQPGDRDGVLDLLARTSDHSRYLRYFSMARAAAVTDTERLLRAPDGRHAATVVVADDRIVAIGSWERLSDVAVECALLVDDTRHGDGIGTLLAEDLAVSARRAGFTRFEADALGENHAVLTVLRELGPTTTERRDGEVVHVVVDLEQEARFEAAVTERERRADVTSLGRVLAPRSVAVVGAGTHATSPGRLVLANLIAGGFTGRLDAVNPHHRSVLGVPCAPDVASLPQTPDLVVVAVPREAVLDVVRACGERGVRGAVVLTAGFGESGPDGRRLQAELTEVARAQGLRLIGPNCLGILNSDPAVALNATFAALDLHPGPFAFASQSGALGIAVLEAAQRRGIGVAQFVSLGNKADVSANDLLLTWADDPQVAVIGLYLESLGNPRKFVRIARSVTARKPVIVLKAGRSDAGARAGSSHTAAALGSDAVVDAVFERTGVVRVDSMGELLDLAHLLTAQPAPRGRRLGVIGNSGGPEILAADRAVHVGLEVPELSSATANAVHNAVPTAASCTNPVDLGATVSAGGFRRAVTRLRASGEVDAVLAVYTATSTTDPAAVMTELGRVGGPDEIPLAAVRVGDPPRLLASSRPRDARRVHVPVFGYPESAATALGQAARHGVRPGWIDEQIPRPAGTDRAAADELLRELGDGWLGPGRVDALLAAYGFDTPAHEVAHDEEELRRAVRRTGWPVAVKATGIVHKSDAGGVRLGVADATAALEAFRAVSALPGSTGALVQAMVAPGVELLLGGVQDQHAGPVVVVGAGGVLTDLLTDRAFSLAPVSRHDGEHLVRSLRIGGLLEGYRGQPAVSERAVVDALRRLAALVDDQPRVAEIDLNPVVASGSSLVVVDARVRLAAPHAVRDSLTRAMTPAISG